MRQTHSKDRIYKVHILMGKPKKIQISSFFQFEDIFEIPFTRIIANIKHMHLLEPILQYSMIDVMVGIVYFFNTWCAVICIIYLFNGYQGNI